MHLKQFVVLSLFCVASVLVHQSSAACGLCEPNGIACITSTSFHICTDNIPNRSQTFFCGKGEVCTGRALKCFPEDAITPACAVSKDCGVCNGSKMFVCISRNKFVQCNGTERTEVIGTCGEGSFCRSSGGEYCVSECEIARDGKFECDNEEVLN